MENKYSVFNVALAEAKGEIVDAQPWELHRADIAEARARQRRRMRSLQKCKQRKSDVSTFVGTLFFMVTVVGIIALIPVFF